MKSSKQFITGLFTAIIAIALTFSAVNSFAQAKPDFIFYKDCCMMKKDQMFCIKDGKMEPMEKAMTMKNGTKCKKNGECKEKDGKVSKLNDGECISMEGEVTTSDLMIIDCCMMKDKKMFVVKDGVASPMEAEMEMSDGSKCMVDGSYTDSKKKKKKMKNGDCMGMDGKMGKIK